MARSAGTEVRYVKPHGALYNAIVHHREHARAVVDAVMDAGRLPCPVPQQLLGIARGNIDFRNSCLEGLGLAHTRGKAYNSKQRYEQGYFGKHVFVV